VRQFGRIQGFKDSKRPGIEHLVNTKTGRNIPKNQGLTQVLKERL
jgi:hypothetical protein